MSRDHLVAAVLVGAALFGGAPWWAAGVVFVAAAWPAAVGPMVGAAALFGCVPWPWGFALLLVPPAAGGRALAAGAFALFGLYAARQLFLCQRFDLPLAPMLGGLSALLGVATGAWITGSGRVVRVGLQVAAAVLVMRTVNLWRLGGASRLAAAQALHAEGWVYDGLLDRPELAEALVRAVPDRDEAALTMGWAAALDAGWRPRRAEGVVVPVARALEARGRGGEALRLLARHPRVGEVDAWRSLFERTQGVPVRWAGAALGARLDGALPRDVWMVSDGYHEELLTTGVGVLVLRAEGQVYEGAPSVRVRLDAAPEQRVVLDGPTEIDLGPVEAGPHRVQLWFDSDLVGPGGDRQVHLTGIMLR